MSEKRKIPATMGTQHPDNARKPEWAERAFLDTQDEVRECFESFSDLGCTEFMWDWEGKHVDEAVVEKLLENYLDFFTQKQLGRDVFLTVRLPNIWEEKGYRIARAFVNVITSTEIVKDVGLHSPPVFEMILPMTTTAERMFFIEKSYATVANAFKTLKENTNDNVNLIPLIEETSLMQDADSLLSEYLSLRKKEFGKPTYLRPFIARSDPALNSGNVAAVLGAKIGLSKVYSFAEDENISVYPIIGVGSLPFRGGLSPNTIREFAQEYSGVRTVTIQSAFRYDYSRDSVKKSIQELNTLLASTKPIVYDDSTVKELDKIIPVFTKNYQKHVESLAHLINRISQFVPPRRERKLHVGLFGYSRSVKGVALPRAIPFVCALYSLGLPPELIGVGRSMQELTQKQRNLLENTYPGFKRDLLAAGCYLNKENLDFLAQTNTACANIVKGVAFLEEYLGKKLEPSEPNHFIHRNLTSNIRLLLDKHENVSQEVLRAAELRQSLG